MSAVPLVHHCEQSAESLLSQAKTAFRMKRSAERTLARLAKYARMTAGMKHDRSEAARQLASAEATLARVLGDAP